MSKSLLKTHLQSLTKEQIIEQVLDMYETYKPAKEYFDYLLNPNEKEHFNKYKSVIINEFYPKGKNSEPTTRFSIAKRAIADFSNLKPSPQLIAELMVTFMKWHVNLLMTMAICLKNIMIARYPISKKH